MLQNKVLFQSKLKNDIFTMNKIIGRQIMKKAENIDLWNHRFTDRKVSGLNVDEWCEDNNISRHSYYYWHRKVQAVPQHASEKRFIEIPVITCVGKSKTQQEGIVIKPHALIH